ncbi:regulatory protein GemA [Novosphingobium sp. LASN5T]|uniref:regulatory protein GemA n=1 Tax=Novosphingobium sp. LASN5T TaxID=2491021 RepID=UPI000F5F9C74|nr:regulatory protein GemA [Novosphingobium sp. LASN5T]RQW45316.1 regulatory protein GemA [Novosphingobium sp. LASN5T]
MNAKRLKLVQIARKALGLDDEAYRAILRNYGGVESSADLDDRGFARVMDRFRYLGFVSDKRAAAFSPHDRIGMASAAQISMIRDLWAANTDGAPEAALNRWLDGHFHISALRFLTDVKARKVIGALKTWDARKQAKAGSTDREANQTAG